MDRKAHVKAAAIARCDLNTFYGVIAQMEASLISAEHHDDCQRIIAICRSASGKALRRYDRHVAAASKEAPRHG